MSLCQSFLIAHVRSGCGQDVAEGRNGRGKEDEGFAQSARQGAGSASPQPVAEEEKPVAVTEESFERAAQSVAAGQAESLAGQEEPVEGEGRAGTRATAPVAQPLAGTTQPQPLEGPSAPPAEQVQGPQPLEGPEPSEPEPAESLPQQGLAEEVRGRGEGRPEDAGRHPPGAEDAEAEAAAGPGTQQDDAVAEQQLLAGAAQRVPQHGHHAQADLQGTPQAAADEGAEGGGRRQRGARHRRGADRSVDCHSPA